MFSWLENTAVALWVGGSLWGYPSLLALHAVGLAIVVGIFAMRDLRLLGLFPALPPAAFLPLSKLGWIGFIVNAVSGILLFTSQAVTFVGNTAFLLKISCIVAAMVLAGIIQSRLRVELTTAASEAAISHSTRVLAAVSLSLWAGAIVAGRLIAYL